MIQLTIRNNSAINVSDTVEFESSKLKDTWNKMQVCPWEYKIKKGKG